VSPGEADGAQVPGAQASGAGASGAETSGAETSGAVSAESLLRELAPQALGAVARRSGDFAAAEDAVQEALLAAATHWPADGTPDNPLGWLIRVAARRMTDQYRSEDARRRREALAASWSLASPAGPVPGEDDAARDDTLTLMFMCCHPSLSPGSAIPLTLRAVGGLTTREIAAAFLVPEPTMAQRVSRAKATLKASGEPFTLPPPDQRAGRLRSVLHVLYLLFNEGYASSSGPDLARSDLSGEAIRLARALHASLPGHPEVTGLLALMLLTEARRPARTGPGGELIPLAQQQRGRWDRSLITEGTSLITRALRQGQPGQGQRGQGQPGEYQLQAAIAAVHDQSPSHAETGWPQILSLYDRLERMTGNPMVTLNRAVAAAMAEGPAAGLALLDAVAGRLGSHHRFHAVRGHLLEMAGDGAGAAAEFAAAAAGTANLRERHYLTAKAASLGAGGADRSG
jgi:RNA polymerase sigma factor (sigma-70 family)